MSEPVAFLSSQKSKAEKSSLSIVTNTMIGFGSDLIICVLALVAGVVIARVLGPQNRGLFAVITLINTYLASVVMFGTGTAAEIQLAKGEYSLPVVHGFAVFFSVMMGFLCLFLFLILKQWFSHLFFANIDSKFCFVALFLVTPVLYLTICNRMMVGMNQILTLNVFKVTKGILDLVTAVFFLLILPFGLVGAVIAWVVTVLVTASIQFWWLLKQSGWKLELNSGAARESFLLGWRICLAFLPMAAVMGIDSFILNHFYGAKAVGLYAVAYGMMFRIVFLFDAFLNATRAKIIGQSRESAEKLVRLLIRHSVFIALMASVTLCLFRKLVIQWLYGGAFVAAADAFVILSVGMIAIPVGNFLGIYAVGQLKKPGIIASVNWLNLVLGLLLYFSLIPKFGLLGAAWASSLISVIRVIGYLWVLRWFSLSDVKDTLFLCKQDLVFWRERFRLLWGNLAVRFANDRSS